MAKALSVSPRPTVIAVQESYKDFYASYIAELQSRTGQTWYGAFQGHCPLGGWNGSTCVNPSVEGVTIFSTFPIVSTSAIYLPGTDCWTSARPALRVAINVNGTTVQVFNTHLQTGNCSNAAQQRYASMTKIKDWARTYSKPQIVAGDFNADPDQIASSQGMSPNFIESFQVVGIGSRFTYPSSLPTMKLDYWFFDSGWIARPVSSEVSTVTGTYSDHRPVRATFLIQ
jgi:endonuclease/exonuclease/phosphatase family metal-dependent hydrolase